MAIEYGGASFKRARYHSSLMDMHSLEPGQNFDGLPEHFVIFITREDVLGSGCKYIMRTESFGKPEKIFLTIHTLSM